MMKRTIKLKLPRPHKAQRQVLNEAKRFNVLACGRRWGKTTLGLDIIIRSALAGHPVAWFAPHYKSLLDVWRQATLTLGPLITKKNASERRIELINGGVIEFWSLEDVDVARGRKYKAVVIDEAAMIRHLKDAWTAAIRPTLADLEGRAWFLSTPKGRNFFWQLYRKEGAEWMRWQMSTFSNPVISPDEIGAMKEDLPERIYLQEIEAQFVEDGGGVFRKVREAVREGLGPMPESHIVIGVDWGKLNDFTVFTVFDAAQGAVLSIDRSNKVDYHVQVQRLKALCDKWKPRVIVAESNSMGEPIIEQLRRDGLPVRPFLTTASSKADAIESLSLAFEQGSIHIPNDYTLIQELEAYEMERLPSGNIRYNAPAGLHDDMVMSLALAFTQTATRRSWLFN